MPRNPYRNEDWPDPDDPGDTDCRCGDRHMTPTDLEHHLDDMRLTPAGHGTTRAAP